MTVTFNMRTLVAFAAGLSVALVAVFVFQAWKVDAAPGDEDATFVPMTPCRLIDTRPGEFHIGPHDTFGASDTKTIAAHGDNGDCTIPTDAVGLSLNVTALDAIAPSFLTIWPDGDRPEASSLNPVPGQPPIPNAVTTTLSGGGSFDVFNLAGTVNVIIDVNGFYTAKSLKELAASAGTPGPQGDKGDKGDPGDDTDLTDLTNRLAAAEAKIVTLDAAQPFAVAARDDFEWSTDEPDVIVSVTVTAPVDGHVVVNSTTNVDTSEDFFDWIECSITTGEVLVDNYLQRWYTQGPGRQNAQLAATRWFILPAGLTRTYNLVCTSLHTSRIADSVLTATFTPAP